MLRARALLLLFPLAAMVLIAIGVGSVREQQGGLAAHYTSYSNMLLVFLYTGWQVVLPRGVRAFVQCCLFALVCSGTTTEAALSLQRGNRQRGLDRDIRRMAAAGAPLAQLAGEFGESIASNETVLAEGLSDLHRAGIKPFRSIDLAPRETVLLPLERLASRGMERVSENRWRGNSSSSFFLIRTSPDRPIAGLRVHYTLHKSAYTAVMELRWPAPDAAFPGESYLAVEGPIRFVKGKAMAHEVKTFWTGEARCERLSFHPSHGEFEIELHEVLLLLANEQLPESSNP